jgi:glycosyltransferase involved in cell wall biosynthesis
MEKNSVLLTMGMMIYNEAKYINEAIDSLLAQTYKDFILIISDNASMDGTSEICKHYAEKDKRIIYIRHNKNTGAFFSFNFILDKINTPFFMFCGGHDRWHPQFIEKLLPIIMGNKELISVYPLAREINIDGSLGVIHQDDYTTQGVKNIGQRYLRVLKRIIKCNIIYGIWRTPIFKQTRFKKLISNDVLFLLNASFLGEFKQYKEVLFFRRIVREEDNKNKYLRQISVTIGGDNLGLFPVFRAKFNFIVENVRILLQKSLPLSIGLRFKLIIKTICKWVKGFYLGPLVRKILKAFN